MERRAGAERRAAVNSQAGQDSDRIGFDPGAVRRIGARQALIRFAAGALASCLAALVSHFAGAAVSGPLLALPAILIASLTLIADEDGKKAAVADTRGAVLGGVGLIGFAVVAAVLLGRAPTWLALIAASATWAAVSLLLYAAQEAAFRWRARSRGQQVDPAGPDSPPS